MTKTIIASLIAVGFATSAFASDASEVLHQDQANQAAVQQHYVAGSQDYAYAPAQAYVRNTAAEQREFNRVTVDTVSSR